MDTYKLSKFIKYIGIIGGIPILSSIAIYFHNERIAVLSNEIQLLKSQISVLQSEVSIKESYSYSNFLKEITSQEEVFERRIKKQKKLIESYSNKINDSSNQRRFENLSKEILDYISNNEDFIYDEGYDLLIENMNRQEETIKIQSNTIEILNKTMALNEESCNLSLKTIEDINSRLLTAVCHID